MSLPEVLITVVLRQFKTYELNCFCQYLDTLFVKDPQAGMDYHELQVKLANRDKELCSKPITTGSKRAKTHTQYESAEKPARVRGKTRNRQECAGKHMTCHLIISALLEYAARLLIPTVSILTDFERGKVL